MNIFIIFSITFAYVFLGNDFSNANPLPYESIFNFGDSLSDTGNAATNHPAMPSNSPYGSTYFKHPSGRMSNGRLIIDFIAEAYGLPMLPAYLNITDGQDIKKGVNFAYAGSTALDQNLLKQKLINVDAAAYSLSTQLDWFKKLKPSLCKSKEEINKRRGVVLVVPGNFPIGCNSAVLATLNTDKEDDYDQFGCLTAYNAFIEYYNEQLKKAIETLRQENPHVRITYFDYYGAAKRFSSGKIQTFKACCGKGEPYGLSAQTPCGSFSRNSLPRSFKTYKLGWAPFYGSRYGLIAKGIVEGPFANPSLKSPPFKIA
ncbi:hypothetical protein Fmac_010302 [Flemingia macrophylla]|uniref:GDSL esterase/lipase n=1 Tax=Flemingia macrophylla TaxID=520843 RepID=A0ABD1MJ75_9FABA